MGLGGVDRITLVQVAGSSECGDEPLGSIKCREFLDCLRTYLLLKKDCAAWSSFVRSFVRYVYLYLSCHVSCRYCVRGLYFLEGPVFRTRVILDVLVEFLVFLGIVKWTTAGQPTDCAASQCLLTTRTD